MRAGGRKSGPRLPRRLPSGYPITATAPTSRGFTAADAIRICSNLELGFLKLRDKELQLHAEPTAGKQTVTQYFHL